MTQDRVELSKLQSDKKKIDKRIKELTVHKCGKSYGKMLSDLLYEYVDNNIENMNTYRGMWNPRYKYYSDLHFKISSRLGVKTKVFTKAEYEQALNIIKSEWGFNFDNKYNP